jgi:hypothetical protein
LSKKKTKTYRVYAEMEGSRPWAEIDIEADGPEEAEAEFYYLDKWSRIEWNTPSFNGDIVVLEVLDTSEEL